uniref:Choline transporter-like protein n=1 Tax=Acrobeloides nanus TaxID=290746 RepID=A0A914DSU6_9BILA
MTAGKVGVSDEGKPVILPPILQNYVTKSDRKCTDVCCCFLFLVFLVGWGVIAVLAFLWGKPERLIHPTDSRGRICGFNRPGAYDLSSKPYLLFFDLTKCVSFVTVLTGCPTPQICVSKCPTEYFSYLQLQQLYFTQQYAEFRREVDNNLICSDAVDKSRITDFTTVHNYVMAEECAPYTLKSAAVLGRCIPLVEDASNALGNLNSANGSFDQFLNTVSSLGASGQAMPPNKQQKIASDLSVTWGQILVLLLASAVASLIWTFIMRLLGGFMIWLSILLLLGLLAGGSGYCWYHWKLLKDAGAVDDFSFQPVFSVYFEMPTTWMIFAIILSILLIIMFVIFLFVRSRIKIAVAMIEETSRAMGNMLSTLFFPIIPFALHLLVFMLWGYIAIWLASSGDENCRLRPSNAWNDTQIANGTKCDCSTLGVTYTDGSKCVYVDLERDNSRILYLQLYNLLGLFWLTCFVSALSDMTLAGAFASHYWAFDKKKDVPSFPVLQALGRSVKYHLGSLAFGSLILAIVKLIRVILDFLYKKLHAAQNPILRGIYIALKCLFWCLESFLRFLTTNAYIMIAIYGKGFCASARDSFTLLARNIVRTVVLGRVTGFLLFVGKALITLGMGTIAFFYFSGRWVIDGLPHFDLYYYFVPVIIVLIGSYYVCDLFFEVFDMGVDTIFLCFCK